MSTSLALIGDYNPQVIAHQAIPKALELAFKFLGAKIQWTWIESSTIKPFNSPNNQLQQFSGFWIVPGSPYANTQSVLKVIQFARKTNKPLLGTCGGFQHLLIEYARNVCEVIEADHAETNPQGSSLIVTPLSCSLVEKTGTITFSPGSYLQSVFSNQPTHEGYHCNYGLNPEWQSRLEESGLRFTGFDESGAIRACELPTHPFFIGALFQPERSAFNNQPHPLITAFLEAVISLPVKKLASTECISSKSQKRSKPP